MQFQWPPSLPPLYPLFCGSNAEPGFPSSLWPRAGERDQQCSAEPVAASCHTHTHTHTHTQTHTPQHTRDTRTHATRRPGRARHTGDAGKFDLTLWPLDGLLKPDPDKRCRGCIGCVTITHGKCCKKWHVAKCVCPPPLSCLTKAVKRPSS